MLLSHRPILFGALALATPFAAHSQSTDGFHANQVLPVVVDSASYKTRITFTSALNVALTVRAFYIPAEGTSQASELDCGTFFLGASRVRAFASLREICPTLPAGSQFGTLHTRVDDISLNTTQYSYAAYARVENPQGIGFSVEGFPGHTLNSAALSVSGLRRSASTATSPAYQTNCFVGSLHLESPNTTALNDKIDYALVSKNGVVLGTQTLTVPHGKLVRVLDVFTHANAPAGDHDDVQAKFYRLGTPAVLAFCTVQENSNFSADFRIGKQFLGQTAALHQLSSSFYAHDDHVMRWTQSAYSIGLTNGAGEVESRPFLIPAGESSNAHVIQFRRPDWAACDLRTPNLGTLNNLEMRLMQGNTVIAGGNNVRSFAPVFLGDNYGAAISNTSYVLEVESSETGTDADTPYLIRCRSGSGHSIPYLVRTGGPNQF